MLSDATMNALHGLGAGSLYAAGALLALVVLVRVLLVRRGRQRDIAREVRRLRHELADREALESRDDLSL